MVDSGDSCVHGGNVRVGAVGDLGSKGSVPLVCKGVGGRRSGKCGDLLLYVHDRLEYGVPA